MQRRQLELENILKPVIEDLSYLYIGLEYIPAKTGGTLRLYIDSEQGIGTDDCKKVSYQVNQVLSVEDSASNYTLEVSSPGVERKLFTAEQCSKQIGKTIKITTVVPIETQRNFKGLLDQVAGEQLYLTVDGGKQIVFDFANIANAQVVAEW